MKGFKIGFSVVSDQSIDFPIISNQSADFQFLKLIYIELKNAL